MYSFGATSTLGERYEYQDEVTGTIINYFVISPAKITRGPAAPRTPRLGLIGAQGNAHALLKSFIL